MDITITVGTFDVAGVTELGIFILAFLFAIFGTLGLLKITSASKFLKMPPETMLIGSIALFVQEPMGALGAAISEFWELAFSLVPLLFLFAAAVISRRIRKAGTVEYLPEQGAGDGH